MSNRIKIKCDPIRLDIGCGKAKVENCVGMDMVDFGQEIVWNLDNGIPLPDDSVSYVHSSHFVEHLTETQIEWFFLELTRVCQDGALIEVRCPHDKTILRYYTSHLSQWNEDRVKGIVQGWNYGNGTFEIADLHSDSVELFFTLRYKR